MYNVCTTQYHFVNVSLTLYLESLLPKSECVNPIYIVNYIYLKAAA